MAGDTQLMGVLDEGARDVHLDLIMPADVQRVWSALTCAGELPSWLARIVGPPLRTGSEFELWHEESVKSSHVVQRWNPPTLLELRWDFPGETLSQVTFHLAGQSDGNTLLTVQHRGLDDPPSYAAGWHRHLTYLASHLTGHDLPWEQFWDGFDELAEKYRAQAAGVQLLRRQDR